MDRKECWKIVNEGFDEAMKIARERLFNHSFTQELKAGTLPIECIRGWVLNFYAYALETNSAAAYQYYLCNDFLNEKIDLLPLLADKRGDEFATPGPGGHQRTMDSLGKALGLDLREMQEHKQLPAMRARHDSAVWSYGLRQRLGAGIGEELFAEWCALWFESLTKHYGLTKEDAYYFSLHAEADSFSDHRSGEAIGHEIMGHSQSVRYIAVRMLEDGLVSPEEFRQGTLRQANIEDNLNFLDAVLHTYHPARRLSDVEQTRR